MSIKNQNEPSLGLRIRELATQLAGGPRYYTDPATGESTELPIPMDFIGAAIVLDVLRKKAESNL